MNDERLRNVLYKMARVRYFEEGLVRAVKDGQVNIPVYLSSGQESVAAVFSELYCGYNLFTQHRSHDWYLCFGGDPKKLRDELMQKDTGTSHGRAGSNCLNAPEIKMWGHHGLIGENVPIGVGYAMATREPTICVFGDGAAEEDYVLSSLGFAATHKLPIIFVCTDNDLSVLTKKEQRRSWNIDEVGNGFGIHSFGSAPSNPSPLLNWVSSFHEYPVLYNIKVHRKHWHVGVGIDSELEVDYFEELKKEVRDTVLLAKLEEIKMEMLKLWFWED